MRIPIREQLTLIIILASLICLGVVSVAVWLVEKSFVLQIRSSRLSIVASLKAAQLTSNLNLMQTSANFVSTRVIIQNTISAADAQQVSSASMEAARNDLQVALAGAGSIGASLSLQAMVFPRDSSGSNGIYSVLNVTGSNVNGTIKLPYTCPDGSAAYLGDDACANDPNNLGYPPALYPNLTAIEQHFGTPRNISKSLGLNSLVTSTLVLGPWPVNSTFSLVSQTVPVINNTSSSDNLGWLTVVMDARLILEIVRSTDGLGQTGQTLLVGPSNPANVFPGFQTSDSALQPSSQMRFVVPVSAADPSRDHEHDSAGTPAVFDASEFSVLEDVFQNTTGQLDNAGADLDTRNEAGQRVSVGYAVPQTDMVDWAVVIEMSRSEVLQPIDRLRTVLLACVFGTAGLMAILAFPLSHFYSLPIRRLREATANSIALPSDTDSQASSQSASILHGHGPQELDGTTTEKEIPDKGGFKIPTMMWLRRRRSSKPAEQGRRGFRIPARVKERKHVVKDELTDLTHTFNEMSDELTLQYEKLEERVQQRTAELELSKKAAEAANESKTLFIANISHELKTPLNGILGMCAVCMQEEDPLRLKRSLGIIYKSGDLLLNLLTDLLTFSKNQVGHQQLSLDEKEFRLRDISSQVTAIFDKQAKEGQIDFRVNYEPIPPPDGDEYAPPLGRIEDMIVWGDIHRVLQVVINLVSNSLKFTPSGGSVTLSIRCLPDYAPEPGSKRGSFRSRTSRATSSRNPGSQTTLPRPDTPSASLLLRERFTSHDRQPSPIPTGRILQYEFQVVDTGPGIPESLQSKIFEPFVQGDLGLSKKYGGTGLGLSICSQLASLMRGTVRVESTVGVGSTFTLRVPLRHLMSRADSSASSTVEAHIDSSKRSHSADSVDGRHSYHEEMADEANRALGLLSPQVTTPAPVAVSNDAQPRLVGLSQPFFASSQPLESPGSQSAAMKKIAGQASRGDRIRVLVAEDNKVNQEVVLRMLQLEDIYDVTIAKDGQEALDLVKESMCNQNGESRPFSLVFMDINMPHLDGLQSTRLIRQSGYKSPIVALTAFTEESNIKDCFDSGMNYFLSKPIRRPQLKKVLRDYCAPIPEENETSEEALVQRRISVVDHANGATAAKPFTGDGSNRETQNPSSGSGNRHERFSRPVSPRTKG